MLADQFEGCYGVSPDVIASAPGRIEVLGNHTDYNGGLTLSCAVALRCYAALRRDEGREFRLASTAYNSQVHAFREVDVVADQGHWSNYVLGLLSALRDLGSEVPGFSLLVDSAVPPSAGLSSSAACEMAALVAIVSQIDAEFTPLELAGIGQHAESAVVGAQTGLLDQLSSLLGRRDQLLKIDFQDFHTRTIPMPHGYCFVCIDSGVQHDLTSEYNDRREASVSATNVMGIATLREATSKLLESSRERMLPLAYACAKHVLDENARVAEACEALEAGDIHCFGQLMYDSHESSRTLLRNSCSELDELVERAQRDPRCLGARLSGGGFGGITIHLVQQEVAEDYRADMVKQLDTTGSRGRWSAICQLDDGATLHSE